jgi:hypothetical protein
MRLENVVVILTPREQLVAAEANLDADAPTERFDRTSANAQHSGHLLCGSLRQQLRYLPLARTQVFHHAIERSRDADNWQLVSWQSHPKCFDRPMTAVLNWLQLIAHRLASFTKQGQCKRHLHPFAILFRDPRPRRSSKIAMLIGDRVSNPQPSDAAVSFVKGNGLRDQGWLLLANLVTGKR